MTIATLTDVLQPAMEQGYAVAGLVTLGWEDMQAYVLSLIHISEPTRPY